MATTAVVGTPDAGEINARLGSSEPLWRGLLDALEPRFGPLMREWKKYSRDSPWVLRLFRQKRCVVYLSPGQPPQATVLLGDKAIATLPPGLRERVQAEKRYPEGTPARIALTSGDDVETVITLITAKLAV